MRPGTVKLRYKDLTKKEKDFICNGCGPKGGPIPVPEFKFTASCNHHDFNYWLGHDEEDRRKADGQFYRAMVADARRYKSFRRQYYLMWAAVYYRAVRRLGREFFYYADKERTRKDLMKEMAMAAAKSKKRKRRTTKRRKAGGRRY